MFRESDQVALRSSLESLVLRGGLLGDPLHFSFHLGLEQKRGELPAILPVVSDMGKGDPNRLFPSTAREQKKISSRHIYQIGNLLLFPHPFLFIGKVELSKLPLFGHFYKRTNILIDRSSLKSIRETMRLADEKLREGYSLCIYPEGGVPSHEVFLGTFKEGAFRLAKDHGLPLLPITFADNKKAYPYVWNRGGPRRLRATVHEAVATEGKSVEDLKTILRTTFERELEEYGISNEIQQGRD